MKTISKLFFFLEDFFFVCQSVSQSNILKSVLMNFLIFKTFTIFPVFKGFLWNLLSCSTKDSVLSDTSLKLFELLFNFVTFCLLFVKLSLKFRGHFIVTILRFFEIDSYLMDISKSIKILMFVHLDIWLFIILLES